MRINKSWGILGQGLAFLAFTAVLAGSGPSGAGLLIQQPQESGIAGHLFVPLANHVTLPQGAFGLILWQPNPSSPNGLLVPSTWDASAKTGFAPASLGTAQLGFQDNASTTAQMEGATVGAYINSADLPGSPAGQKMMITPQFTFAAGTEPVPFLNASSVLSASMDLQVPVAVGSSAYVLADFLFVGPNGVRISYGVKIFSNGAAQQHCGSSYNVDGNSYQLNCPIGGADQRFVSPVLGSALAAGTPWLGWRYFEWTVSEPQFVAALKFLVAQYPGKVQSTDPTQYVLREVHLNAELHSPAELGWSMRGWNVWTASATGSPSGTTIPLAPRLELIQP
jgi:hypothetical protein